MMPELVLYDIESELHVIITFPPDIREKLFSHAEHIYPGFMDFGVIEQFNLIMSGEAHVLHSARTCSKFKILNRRNCFMYNIK